MKSTKSSARSRADSRRRNFTLIEVVVAVTIFALVSLLAGFAMLSVRDTWRRTQSRSERLDNRLKIDRVVESCFRNIIPFTWPDEDDADRAELPVFRGDNGTVSFAYLHRVTKADFSAIRFLRLYENDGNLVAEYRKTPIVGKDDGNLTTEVLASGLQSVSFRYADYDESGELEWLKEWVRDPEDKTKKNNDMPMAVQMTVEWLNGDTETWLRRTAGSGLCESLGAREIKKAEGVGDESGGGTDTGEPRPTTPPAEEKEKRTR